jgi:NNP family nitrate/nitrite transporter-like MFS transporter
MQAAALTKFVAPSLVMAYGWQAVPKIYAMAMIVVVVTYWIFTYEDPNHQIASTVTMKEQLKALNDPNLWCLVVL